MLKLKNKIDFNKYITFDGIIMYLLSGLALIFMFLLYSQFDQVKNQTLSQILIFGSVTVCLAFGLYLKYQGKLNVKNMIIMVMIVSFCVKLAYAVATPYNVHQHDVESLGRSGHLQYIYNLAIGNNLPDTNVWQFSHPPLHHFIAALVVKLGSLFKFSFERSAECVQYLTVFYSFVTSVWFYKILRFIGIRGRALLFSVMLFCFHPTFTILAGSINNDILTIMLCTGAIYYLLKWYQKPSFVYAAVLGVLTGLAMMTKFSASLTVAVIGITVLVKIIKEQQFKLFWQVPIFLVLCLPLGLWYQIRNMQLFEQPLGYVAPLDTSNGLYIGKESIVSRLFFPPLKELFSVFCDPWENVNLTAYTLKSSLFGEYKFSNVGVAILLYILNVAMIALTIYAMVKFIKSKNLVNFGSKLILMLNFFVQIGFFVYFNISYPFGCTMDFRYLVLTLVSGIATLAIIANAYQKQASVDKKAHIKMSLFGVLSFAFSFLSVMLFV